MPTALVLGCAECVWADARKALEMFTPDAFIGTKEMMILWPGRIDYGVNLHPERTARYMEERRKLGRNSNFPVYSHKQPSSDRFAYPHRITSDWQGSTGLLGVKVALIEEDFDAVVLAGVPLEGKYGHVARKKTWGAASMFKKGWERHFNEIIGRVRSMSGWTQQLLGAPTPEWLREKLSAPPDAKCIQQLEVANGYNTAGNP